MAGATNLYYLDKPANSKTKFSQLSIQKRQAQEAWLAILSHKLLKEQQKKILSFLSPKIVPWFSKPELLMDFLTSSFDAGGSISLMALSGLFHLIQEKSLDYPQFYSKLYSLLDFNILHSKHRPHFSRSLEVFLASTHLPAVLVASFIKRLSRLCLSAPPSGIMIVIPFIYNLLKLHPACTFMIHRKENSSINVAGEFLKDPFNMNESDPMETEAIESSLWEVYTLQSHYQPQVAIIAKIISEQFTKDLYPLEDFLDHSYRSVGLLSCPSDLS